MGDFTKSFSFEEAIISPTHVVCSVKLLPFSLGHWTFMDSYASPLLSPDPYPEEVSNDPNENFKNCIRHILLFVMVCGNSYEDNKRLIDDKEFFDITKETLETKASEYIKCNKNWNIYVEVNAVKEYLNYYMNSMPNFVETGPPSPPSGIDWKANVYAVLKNEYGYTENQIMNFSMRRVYQEWTVFAAKSGSIKVKPKMQIDAEEQAAEMVAKIKSGKIRMEDVVK